MELITTREIHGHTIEVYLYSTTRTRSGAAKTTYVAKVDGHADWTERRTVQAWITWAEATYAPEPASTPGVVTGRTGWSKYSRRSDQVGGYLADSFGMTSPATARSECHFCGQPLSPRGECRECH